MGMTICWTTRTETEWETKHEGQRSNMPDKYDMHKNPLGKITNPIIILHPSPPIQQDLPEFHAEEPKDQRPVGPGARQRGKLSVGAKPFEPTGWKRDGQRLSRSPMTSTPTVPTPDFDWERIATIPPSPNRSAIRPPRPFLAPPSPASLLKIPPQRLNVYLPQMQLPTLKPLPPYPTLPPPTQAGGEATATAATEEVQPTSLTAMIPLNQQAPPNPTPNFQPGVHSAASLEGEWAEQCTIIEGSVVGNQPALDAN